MSDSPDVKRGCNLWADAGGLAVVMAHLWPLLDERTVLRAMRSNRAAMACYRHYPHRHRWTEADIQQRLQLQRTEAESSLRWPRIERVAALTSIQLISLLPHLRQLTLQQQGWEAIEQAVARLPELRQLTLAWPDQLCSVSPPCSALSSSGLVELVLHGYDAPLAVGVLPAGLLLLETGLAFDQPILPGVLPPLLTHLVLTRGSWWTGEGSIAITLSPPSSHDSICGGEGRFDQPLADGALPDSLQCLMTGSLFSQPLPARLPPALRWLVFQSNDYTSRVYSRFNHRLQLSSSQLRCLYLPRLWDQQLDSGALPDSLTELHVGPSFGTEHPAPFVAALPASLTVLDLQRSSFKQQLAVGLLPPALTELDLGDQYCQPLLPQVLPRSLQRLRLGWDFAQPLASGVLPESLTQLTMECNKWAHTWPAGALPASLRLLDLTLTAHNTAFAPGALPAGLLSLLLSMAYNQPFAGGALPAALETLQVPHELGRVRCGRFNQPLEPGALPARLRHLQLSSHFTQPLLPGHLPPALQTLHLGDDDWNEWRREPEYSLPLQVGALPSSLLSLHVTSAQLCCDLDQGVLPACLQQLSWNCPSPRPWQPGVLPASLLKLDVGELYNQPFLPGSLPASLRELCVRGQSERSWSLPVGLLPPSLKLLDLGAFNQPLIAGVLPASLRYLGLGQHFSQPLPVGVLPRGLHTLRISSWQYEHEVEVEAWPADLAVLVIHEQYPHTIPARVLRVDERSGDGGRVLSHSCLSHNNSCHLFERLL